MHSSERFIAPMSTLTPCGLRVDTPGLCLSLTFLMAAIAFDRFYRYAELSEVLHGYYLIDRAILLGRYAPTKNEGTVRRVRLK